MAHDDEHQVIEFFFFFFFEKDQVIEFDFSENISLLHALLVFFKNQLLIREWM